MSGRGFWALSALVAGTIFVTFAGCTTYGSIFYIERVDQHRPGAREHFSDVQVESAREIARAVAEKHGLREAPDAANSHLPPWRVISFYQGRGWGNSDVRFTVEIKDDRSALVFRIWDRAHGSETPFVTGIRRELEKEVAESLPGHKLVVQKASGYLWPLAP